MKNKIKLLAALSAGLLLAALPLTGCQGNIDFDGISPSRTLVSVSITRAPDKTEYFINAPLNLNGLEVTVAYSDNSTEIIDNSELTITGFDSGAVGEQEIVVSYGSKSDTFKVTVNNVTLLNIEITAEPHKTEYFIDAPLNLHGLEITAAFSDDSAAVIDNSELTVSGFDSSTPGTKTVTVTYVDQIVTFTVTVKDITLVKIEITAEPVKRAYWVNESFDSDGLEITAVFSDDSTAVIDNDELTSDFDSSTAGTKTVTVTYGGQIVTFTVTVNNVTLTGIEITAEPSKTSYWVNESFDSGGLEVTAVYSNGSTAVIGASELSISGFDSSTAGTKTVTVTYNGQIVTFTVTVNNVTLTGIEITAESSKTEYIIGASINLEGLEVTAAYSNGSTVVIGVGDLTVGGFDSSTPGTKIVTVTYGDKSDSFTVTVIVPGGPFDVTFNSNGGSAVQGQSIDYGNTADKPADPVKTGYNSLFDGWYTDNTTFNNQWVFTVNTVTANVELYAKWRPYEIGDTGPGGGKIFYRDANGFTVTGTAVTGYYLEASPEDLSSAEWGASGDDIEDETGYITGWGIGDGKFNTQILVDFLNDEGEKGKAAQVCASYTNNGLTDWFLPSMDELYELFINREAAGITNLKLSSSNYYWSSTEGSTRQNALTYYYSTTNNIINEANRNRTTGNNVRAIRVF